MRTRSRFVTSAMIGIASVLGLLAVSTRVAQATPLGCTSACLFYGGDYNPNNPFSHDLVNAKQSQGYYAAVYVPFVVPIGQTWNITGLFGNNAMSFTPLTADWSIRSGVSNGNGGTVLFSGSSSSPVVADTGVSEGGNEIYAVGVNGLSGIQLGAGTYWLSVVPVCLTCSAASYLVDTDGSNASGPAEPQNQSYLDSSTFNASFQSTTFYGAYPAFSVGVIGTLANGVPEPAALGVFGTGLTLLAGLLLRRRYAA